MLISEALQRRRFHETEIQELEQRIIASLWTREGSDPAEDPKELIAKLVVQSDELGELTKKLHRTNHIVKCGSISLAEARIRQETYKAQLKHYHWINTSFEWDFWRISNPESQKAMRELFTKTKEAGVAKSALKNLEKDIEFYDLACTVDQMTETDEIEQKLKALEAQILETQMNEHLVDT